jgi:hypothetical protein
MTAFGAVAVKIPAFVIGRLDGAVKKVFSFFDLISDLGQVGHFEGCPVFFYQHHQRDTIEDELVFFQVKSFLRKIIGLVNEVKIPVVQHGLWEKGLNDKMCMRIKRAGAFFFSE